MQLHEKLFIQWGKKIIYTKVSLTEYSVILRDILNLKSHKNLSSKTVITTSIVYLHNGKYWQKNASAYRHCNLRMKENLWFPIQFPPQVKRNLRSFDKSKSVKPISSLVLQLCTKI